MNIIYKKIITLFILFFSINLYAISEEDAKKLEETCETVFTGIAASDGKSKEQFKDQVDIIIDLLNDVEAVEIMLTSFFRHNICFSESKIPNKLFEKMDCAFHEQIFGIHTDISKAVNSLFTEIKTKLGWRNYVKNERLSEEDSERLSNAACAKMPHRLLEDKEYIRSLITHHENAVKVVAELIRKLIFMEFKSSQPELFSLLMTEIKRSDWKTIERLYGIEFDLLYQLSVHHWHRGVLPILLEHGIVKPTDKIKGFIYAGKTVREVPYYGTEWGDTSNDLQEEYSKLPWDEYEKEDKDSSV